MSAAGKIDPQVAAHLEWIGYVQPTGLVVSAPALVRAGAVLDRRDAEGQRLLRSCVEERVVVPDEPAQPWLPDFRSFAETVLGWNFTPSGYAGTEESPIPPELEATLTDFDETLRPDFAVRDLQAADDRPPWQILVSILEPMQSFDEVWRGPGGLEASAHGRMERLLRQTGVPAGLLFNGAALRLISAPRGESSGWMDFRVADMMPTPGRPICTALRLLLNQQRLLASPRDSRLAALLEDSRKYQNEVSERLAEQVLHALYELLRGLQAAHDSSGGVLLRDPLQESPAEVYHALLTVVLRLVFLLYAEERDMLPEDEVYQRYYALSELHKRLQDDAALNPDTMDQRYGAWAQLTVLFRMIHDGARFGETTLPQRRGVLFDPDRYPFLEGRPSVGGRQAGERIEVPLIPDGTVYRALEYLMLLDGERISYRALDVEQIGSVYETMMGFKLEHATGLSVAIKAQKKLGAPVTIDLEALLAEAPGQRKKWIETGTGRSIPERVAANMKAATSLEDLHAALTSVVELHATPDLVPPGAMVLQPSEERRRSGSHYTPRSLTEPIVRTTLEPILERLHGEAGESPAPEQILELKVCDPAMGSGAFLVETCRQLGDALIEAWNAHGGRPEMPPDEDEVIFARRMVAQRCLYGVDRNPVAVDLAKVSLWLVTLARDHALTFVDHALRHGDTLVGLTNAQIADFRWDEKAPAFEAVHVGGRLHKALELRDRIRTADDSVTDDELREWWRLAEDELDEVRLYADLVVAAFFSGQTAKDRENQRVVFADAIQKGTAVQYRGWLDDWRVADQSLVPFHWELEFPEVSGRGSSGFDAFVGNPPFMGGTWISGQLGEDYLAWLKQMYSGGGGRADLVSYFFRRAFELLRFGGCLGLIATNTVAQGDTRATGLAWIGRHDGHIFSATRRLQWPGQAAVVVSVVHMSKGVEAPACLDGHSVEFISAFLFHAGRHEDPLPLQSNRSIAFKGIDVYGMGFTFDDTDASGVASPCSVMHEILRVRPESADRIRSYLGGSEINSHPRHEPFRWVIDLDDLSEAEARQKFPELMGVVEEKVRPERLKLRSTVDGIRLRRDWWRFNRSRPELARALAPLSRALVRSQVSTHHAVAFEPVTICFSNYVIVFAIDTYAGFAGLQARPHEVWARFFGSSMKDDLRYTPSDCFETFPFPEGWENDAALDAAGDAYYTFRADLMVHNDEGLTKTYNRLHDPEEDHPEIARLRELHADMDRAVLDAYGWSDIPTACEFLLDYEIDEEEWGRKKKPYRYRWPDDVRDEVLARLLELNARRAEEEKRAGWGAAKKGKKAAQASEDQGRLC